jgi:Fe-S cluster assembly scaffold protein SufB
LDADLNNRPVYRSLSARRYGSTINAEAHRFSSVPTSRKVPTGKVVSFALQLSHAFASHKDQELRNRVYSLRKEEEEKISACKLRRDAQDMEDDAIIQEAHKRKRARAHQFMADVEVIKREASAKAETVRKMQQEVEIDAALD